MNTTKEKIRKRNTRTLNRHIWKTQDLNHKKKNETQEQALTAR